jgi:hypothetical protein
MGVVDFYTSRDGGRKERVSVVRKGCFMMWLTRGRLLEVRKNEFRGLPSGSGNAGSSLTMFTCTLLDEVSSDIGCVKVRMRTNTRLPGVQNGHDQDLFCS